MTRSLEVARERWPLRAAFTISRGTRTASEVVVARVREGEHEGRGECLPYARYGETAEGVTAAIEALGPAIRGGLGRTELEETLPAGAARNALDCALWDLECKATGRRAWETAGLAAPGPLVTAYTLSLDRPDAMRAAAARNADRPLLKLKLGGAGDLDRVAAVREGAPEARIIVDANEGWTPEDYAVLAPELARLGVAMIEQPLPAGSDEELSRLTIPSRSARTKPATTERPWTRSPGATMSSTSSSTRPAGSARRSRCGTPPASGASRSWWGA